MGGELRYAAFDVGIGWIGILGSAKGLLQVTLPQRSVQEACQLLVDCVKSADWTPSLYEDLAERLKIYFRAKQVNFPDKLDLSAATPFQRKVWESTRLIPYGETRSYAWIARQIGKPRSARAVGQALGKNSLLIIVPCHRVIASDGKLGGFAGGVKMKKYLLDLEANAMVS